MEQSGRASRRRDSKASSYAAGTSKGIGVGGEGALSSRFSRGGRGRGYSPGPYSLFSWSLMSDPGIFSVASRETNGPPLDDLMTATPARPDASKDRPRFVSIPTDRLPFPFALAISI